MKVYGSSFPYNSWGEFIERVVMPAFLDDGETPQHFASGEFERMCIEHPSYIMACLVFQQQRIKQLEEDWAMLTGLLDGRA